MSAQIFHLAMLNGVRVMGIADTKDDAVSVIYIEAPPAFGGAAGDMKRGPGKLTPREAIALGHVLVELGEGALAGTILRNANLGEGNS